MDERRQRSENNHGAASAEAKFLKRGHILDFEILKKRSQNLAYEITSLQQCKDEPIAFCGAVQPGGLLVVADCGDFRIRAVSRNWDAVISAPSQSMLGKKLTEYLSIEGQEQPDTEICELIHTGRVKISLPSKDGRRPVQGSCYRVKSNLVIEFEFPSASASEDATRILKNLVHQIKEGYSVESIAQDATYALKELSGIDRVMVYRFDMEWNGEVIAEARESFLEPFLHLRYPAEDIPAQARQLFFQNRSRMIIDVNSEPVPIVTDGFHPAEIDLSNSVLRAVSPIHIQYLMNMGVTASFSAPIRVGHRLWGLIACHHYSGPRHISPEVRSAFELASQIVSGKIGDFVTARRFQSKTSALLLTQTLLAGIASGLSPIDCFKANEAALLGLTESTGAFVRVGGQELYLGDRPDDRTCRALFDHVKNIESMTSWKSDGLAQILKTPFDSRAAGALAIPLSLGFEDTLIWFRPEEISEVRWAGKPAYKEPSSSNTLARLTPRSSFAEWREKREEHSRAWTEADEESAQYLLFGFVQGIFSKAQALSTAYQELEAISRAKDEFIGTISHELRTPLSIIIGWIDILKDFPQAHPEAQEAIDIIDRNARTQVALIDDLLDISRIIAGKLRLNPEPNVSVNQLISNLVESLGPTAETKNISLRLKLGVDERISVDPNRLRQIVWNLITNALKFTPKGGTVIVSVEKLRSNCQITVEDNGIGIDPSKLSGIFGRFVQAKAASAQIGGLGLGLSIVKSLVELHGGRVEAFSEGEGRGSKFVVTLPVYALSTVREALPVAAPTDLKTSSRLSGLKVLIAEDQPDSLRSLILLVERNGGIAVGAPNGQEALLTLRSQKFDLILSDVGMPEMDGHQMIRTWRQEEKKHGIPTIPAIALTAYAASRDRTKALEAGFQSHVPKPVDRAELMAVIASFHIGSPDLSAD